MPRTIFDVCFELYSMCNVWLRLELPIKQYMRASFLQQPYIQSSALLPGFCIPSLNHTEAFFLGQPRETTWPASPPPCMAVLPHGQLIEKKKISGTSTPASIMSLPIRREEIPQTIQVLVAHVDVPSFLFGPNVN